MTDDSTKESVWSVMPQGVDLDIAQISAAAGLLPVDTRVCIGMLIAERRVEAVTFPNMSRTRYRRVAERRVQIGWRWLRWVR